MGTFDHSVTFNKQLTYNTPPRHIVRETLIEMETSRKPLLEVAPTTLETFYFPPLTVNFDLWPSNAAPTLLVDFHFLPTDIAVNFWKSDN